MNSSFLKRDVTAVLSVKSSNVTANNSFHTETSEGNLIQSLVNVDLISPPVMVNAPMMSAPPPFAEAYSTGKKHNQNSRHQMRQKAQASVVDPPPLNINSYNINNGFSSNNNHMEREDLFEQYFESLAPTNSSEGGKEGEERTKAFL